MTSPNGTTDGTVNGVATFDPFVEIGVSGVNRSGGYIDDEILNDLRGGRKKNVIRQMMYNDATIGALLFGLKMMIRQVDYWVEPASQDNIDLEAAELVRTAIFEDMSISWKDLLSDIASFLPWGWAWFETVYKHRDGDNRDPSHRSKYTDGKVGFRKWAIRSQETLGEWVFDSGGGVQAMKQIAPPDYRTYTMSIEKSILFKTENNRGNPEGMSILRTAYRAWRMKTRIENLEGIGIERDYAGMPVARMPSAYMDENASPEKQRLFTYVKKLVRDIRRDEMEGLVFPSERDSNGHLTMDISLMSTGGSRQFDIDKTINRWDQRMLMSVLADFMMLGAEQHGSFALSSDKTDLFAVAGGAWLDSMCGVINQHPIPRLIRMNGLRVSAMPRVMHGDIETEDKTVFSESVARLLTAGALTPDRTLEDATRKMLALPALPEDVIVPVG